MLYDPKKVDNQFSPYFKARILYYGSQNFKNIFLTTFKARHRTDFGLKVSKMFYGPFWLRVVPFQRHFRRFYTDFTQKIPFFKKKIFLPQKLLFTQKIKKTLLCPPLKVSKVSLFQISYTTDANCGVKQGEKSFSRWG